MGNIEISRTHTVAFKNWQVMLNSDGMYFYYKDRNIAAIVNKTFNNMFMISFIVILSAVMLSLDTSNFFVQFATDSASIYMLFWTFYTVAVRFALPIVLTILSFAIGKLFPQFVVEDEIEYSYNNNR